MEQRISLVTLGVKNLARSRQFYEQGLGWLPSSASNEHIAFYQAGGMAIALYPVHELAKDANLPLGVGFGGMTLAYNVRQREEADLVLAQAQAAGAAILKPAADAFWGGYSGYFADLDGYPWEVAWNPHFSLDQTGNLTLPD